MSELFIQVLKLSLTGSYTILFVILIRKLLSKAPKIFSYLLWSVVLFRLVCPYSFNYELSLVPEKVSYPQKIEFFQEIEQQDIPRYVENEKHVERNKDTEISFKHTIPSMEIMQGIWVLGVATMEGYGFISYFVLKRKLKNTKRTKEGYYCSDEVPYPFVMGIFCPKIYLPKHLSEEEKRFILEHERMHILRKDHIVKPISFVVLGVHWFNPLVWIAYFSMGKDMEISCDEAVIKRLGNEAKKNYSRTILNMASRKPNFAVSPVAFTDHNVKNRIAHVLNYKKPAIWVLGICTMIITLISIGLAGNRIKTPILNEAIQNIAPFTKIISENYIKVKEISDKEITVVKLKEINENQVRTGNNSLFLVFRNGNLEDVYYDRESLDFLSVENYSAAGAEKVAKDFIREVYGFDAEINDKIRRGVTSTKNIPEVLCEFTGTFNNRQGSVVVSLTTGMVYQSSINELWSSNWEYYENENSENKVILSDDLIYVINQFNFIDIYPYQGSKSDIKISDYDFEYQESYIILNDEKMEKRKVNEVLSTTLDINYFNTRDALYFPALTNAGNLFLNETGYEDDMIEHRKRMLSTAAMSRLENKEINWKEQWKTVKQCWDNYVNDNYEYTYNGAAGTDYNGYQWIQTVFTNKKEQCSMIEMINFVEEDGKFKVNDYHFIPDSTMWQTKGKDSPKDVVLTFVECMKTKNTENLLKIISGNRTRQKEIVYNLLDFVAEEAKLINIESIKTNKNEATAIIRYKKIRNTTDKFGNTSEIKEDRYYTLYLIKDTQGWMLYDFPTALPWYE